MAKLLSMERPTSIHITFFDYIGKLTTNSYCLNAYVVNLSLHLNWQRCHQLTSLFCRSFSVVTLWTPSSFKLWFHLQFCCTQWIEPCHPSFYWRCLRCSCASRRFAASCSACSASAARCASCSPRGRVAASHVSARALGVWLIRLPRACSGLSFLFASSRAAATLASFVRRRAAELSYRSSRRFALWLLFVASASVFRTLW